MRGSFRKQLAKLTLPVALAVLVAFASGQRAQSERVDRVHAEADDVWLLVDDGIARSEGKSTATAEEKARWRAIGELFDRALPTGDVRLVFSREVAQLATTAGVESFALQETLFDEHDSGRAGGDPYAGGSGASDGAFEDEDTLDEGMGDDRFGGAGRPVPVEVVRHVYTLNFNATYDALARFTTGLGRMSAVVEVESAVVERTVPLLNVSMKVAAYGKAST